MEIKKQMTEKTRATYTRRQALDLFQQHKIDISETTLYRRVQSGEIRSYLPTGKKRGATFDKEDIDTIISKASETSVITQSPSEQILKKRSDELEESAGVAVQVSWVRPEDAPIVFKLDFDAYGLDLMVPTRTSFGWFHKNNRMCCILHNPERTVAYGAMTILLLREDTILQILRGEIKEKDITNDDILLFEPGNLYTGYIASFVTLSGYNKYIRRMLQCHMQFWIENFPQTKITKLYAYASSEEGRLMMKHLYCTPRYDLNKQAFELDLFDVNPSELITRFQQRLYGKDPTVFAQITAALGFDVSQRLIKTKEARKIKEIREFESAILSEIEKAHGLPPGFRVATHDDIKTEFDIDISLYGEQYTTPLQSRIERMQRNHSGNYLLERDGIVVGYICFYPMDDNTLQKILSHELHRVPTEAILPFTPGEELNIFFFQLSVRPNLSSQQTKMYARQLIAGAAHIFGQLGKSNIEIDNIYATSRTPTGIKLCSKLGMSKEPTPNDPGCYNFSLNIRTSGSRLAREYQRGLAEFEQGISTFSSHEMQGEHSKT